MARVEVLTNIPPDEVDQVVEDYESEGAVVKRIKQPDGNWTVKAKFPE